jgi:hypothetical protein
MTNHEVSLSNPIKEQAVEDATSSDETASNSDSSSTETRAVHFSTIEIREYPRCLGDHPSVTQGPPLSIGWQHVNRWVLPLEESEAAYPDRKKRCAPEFQLPAQVRWQIVEEECVCTRREIDSCLKQVQKSKRKRQSTYAMQDFEHIQESLLQVITGV